MTEEEIKAMQDKIAELTDANEKITKNRDDILGEKRNAQQTSQEKDQIIEDARKAAVTAEEERLVESGRYKEALELREKETTAAIATANASALTAKDALQSRDRGDIMNKVMGNIHDDHKWNSEAMLSNMLKDGYNDQQQYAPTFEHNGVVVANSVDEFKSWAGEQDSFKRILKGVDSSGADTLPSSGAGGKKMTLTEQAIHANKTGSNY
jgi:hypothetical protein